MSHNNIRSETNKSICHGFNCFNIATHCIKVDGYDGTLMLCDDCIKKFPERVTDKPQILNNRLRKQHALTPRVRIDQSNSGRTEL